MSNTSKEYKLLLRSAREKHLPHCLLLQGPDALTLHAATDAAAALLCPVSGDEGCGCQTCRRIREGIHPDVVTLDRADAIIPVDDIRQLRSDAVIAPLEARGRVFIIKNAQNMNRAAQNAALKLFEEPPEGVSFFLLAQNADALMQTVRSRCTDFYFGAQDDGEKSEEEREEEKEAAAQAEEFIRALAADDELELFLVCSRLEKLKRPACAAFFDAALDCVRTALLAAARGEDAPLAKLGREKLYRMARILLDCRAEIDMNVNTAHLTGTVAPLYFGKQLPERV